MNHIGRLPSRKSQSGLSLVITLIVLVVVTLSSVAMIATMRAGVSASSNVAFRQAATRTAELGVEDALSWMRSQSAASLLTNSGTAVASTHRYYAMVDYADPGCTKDGSSVFRPDQYRFSDSINGTTGVASPCAYRVTNTPAGYSLFYVVHRMASSAGNCTDVGCMRPSGLSCSGTTSSSAGRSNEGDFEQTPESYFLVTVKVAGPRQNNRYVQAYVC